MTSTFITSRERTKTPAELADEVLPLLLGRRPRRAAEAYLRIEAEYGTATRLAVSDLVLAAMWDRIDEHLRRTWQSE